jgi:hypothetical protein
MNTGWIHYDHFLKHETLWAAGQAKLTQGNGKYRGQSVPVNGTGFHTIGLEAYRLHRPTTSAFTHDTQSGFGPEFEFRGEGENGQVQTPPHSMQVSVACMREFERNGHNIVTIGPVMADGFADTTLEHVPSSHLKSPWEGFYVSLLDSNLRVWGGEAGKTLIENSGVSGGHDIIGTGWHQLSGAYVVWQQGFILIHFYGKPNDLSVDPMDCANGWFCFPLYDPNNTITGLDEDSPREGNIEEWLSACVDHPHNEESDFDPAEFSKAEQRDMMKSLLRIIINAVLYMNSPRGEVKKSSNCTTRDNKKQKAERLMEQAEKTSGRNRRKLVRAAQRQLQKAWLKGHRTVWIGPTIEESVSRGAREGTKKRKGHIRKGHWHLFRIGPMKDEGGEKIANHLRGEVIHWIPPSWVGDLDDMGKPKNYQFRPLEESPA